LVCSGGFLRVSGCSLDVLAGILGRFQLNWDKGGRSGGEGVAMTGSDVGGGVEEDI
jgi:hypothetical protein